MSAAATPFSICSVSLRTPSFTAFSPAARCLQSTATVSRAETLLISTMLLKRTSKLVLLLTRRQATRLISAYGGREYLIDIYYGLTKALGVDVEPNFGPDRKGDIKHSNADISKARKLLGYDPDYSFRDGIKLAIEWYKENL